MDALAGLLPLSSLSLILTDVALKSTLLLALAVALTRLMRGRSAATRHHVWTLAVAGVLVLPVLNLVLPPLRLELLPALARAAAPAEVAPLAEPLAAVPLALAPTDLPAVEETDAASAEEAATTYDAARPEIPPATARESWTWWQIVIGVWALGAMLLLARLAVGTALVWRMARRARPVRDPLWLHVATRASFRLHLSREVPLRIGAHVSTPLVFGVVDPTILLPAESLAWSEERRRVVALHELAHVKRGDPEVELLVQIALSVFWMHPLMWLAARQMRLERERACDDCVLAADTKPSVYADHLLDIVRALGAETQPSFAALAMARRSQFEGRLLAILDPRQRRGSLSARARSAGATAAAVILLPLSAVNPWLQGPGAPEPTPAPAPTPAPTAATITAPAPEAAPTAPAPQPAPSPVAFAEELQCAGRNVRGTWIHTSDVKDEEGEGRTRMILARDGRCVEMVSEGRVRFTDDERDIASIGPNGYFSLEEDVGGVQRKLVARPAAGGGVERRYTVDGRPRDFDADGRRWLASVLLEVIRESGYDAPGRVQRLLAAGGVGAVLAEVDQIRSSGVKTRYLEAVLDARPVSRDTLVLIAARVGRDVSSSGDKARLLAKIAELPQKDASVNPSLVQAAESIASSGDKRRVLSAIARSDGVETLVMVARAARGIASSGDKAAVLLEVAARWVDEEQLRTEFLRSAATIASSGDKTRVLAALLERAELSEGTLVELLGAAESIASSGDRARVLVAVADKYPLSGARVREAFYDTFREMSSSGDMRRVMTAVLARRELAEAELVAALDASAKIASSSDRAAVMIDVARHGIRSPAVREAFLKAAETLSSDSDYRRVMSAVTRGGGDSELQL